jgi:SLT domain-containing protein
VAAEAVQKQIDDIKDKYGAAIDAVRASIDKIKEQYDGAETAVQRQIDLVKDKYGGAVDGLREKIARIKDDEVARLDPLQRQLALLENANKLVRERQDAERAITNAKTQQLMLDALGDPKLRAQLSGQLAGVEAQQQQVDLAQQLAEAQARLAAGGLSASEQRSLQLKIQQLEIQKKLADMVDTTRLAEATQQSELESSTEKQLTTTRAIEDAHNRIKEIPLKEQINEIQQAAEAALHPLNAQLHEVEIAQKAALDPLQDKLRGLKAAEADALVPLQSRLKQIERDQKAALDPLQDRLKEIKREEQDALRPLESHLKDVQREAANADRVFDAMLAAIARQQRDVLKPLDDQLTVYQHQKAALTEQRQELERIKAQLGEALQIQQEAERAAKEAAKNRPDTPGAPAGGIDFALDAKAQAAAEAAKSAGANLAQKLGEGFVSWWETNKTTVIERVVGAIAGGLIGGPIGALAGAAFLPQFIEKLQEKLRERGFDVQPFIDALGRSAQTGDYREPAFQIASGITFAITRLPWTISKAIWGAISAAWTRSNADEDNVGRAILRGIGDGLKRMFSADLLDLGGFARGIFVGIGNALRGVTDEISKASAVVGTAIWEGIGAGLKAGFVGVGDFLRWAVDGMIGIFKRMLGIASPSTVMQEIGVQTIDGLLLGITTKWNDLKKWWEELPKNIQTAFGWSGSGFTWVADLKAIGSKMLENIWEGLDAYWTQFSRWWTDLPKDIQTAFGWSGGTFTWAADLKTIGSTMLTNIWDGLNDYWGQFSQWWQDLPGEIQKAFGWSGSALTWAANLKAIGTAILESLWSGLDAYWRDHLEPWWGDFKDAIFRAMGIDGTAIDWLKDAGRQVLQSFWDGLNELWGDEENPGTVKGLIKTITDWIPDFIKEALGVHSPSQVMHDLGHNTMQGLINGLRSRFPDLQTTVKEAMSHLSGGLGRIRFPGGDLGDDGLEAIMQAATSLAGVSSDWIDGLRWIAQHESGGDPYAVNPQEVGNGEHASGLMQTIPSTFAAYRSHDLPNDIFNPLANAVAAIRYIKDTYDGNINWVIEHWAERGGYAEGGWAGLHGPELAWLGERGPEYIIPNHALAGGAGAGAPSMQTIRLDVALDGQVKQRLWIEGYQLLARRGGLPGRFGDFA